MENQFKCSGDCLKCHPNQRAYCAAQFTYNSMRKIDAIGDTLEEIKAKLDAIQDNEAHIFDPTSIAQEGSGAE